MGNYEGKNSKPPISGDNVPFINQNEGLQEKDDNEEIKDQTYNLIQDNNHPNNISNINDIFYGNYPFQYHSFDNFEEENKNGEASQNNDIPNNQKENIKEEMNNKSLIGMCGKPSSFSFEYFMNLSNEKPQEISSIIHDSFDALNSYNNEINEREDKHLPEGKKKKWCDDLYIRDVDGELHFQELDFDKSLCIDEENLTATKNKSLDKKDLEKMFDVLTNLLNLEDGITPSDEIKMEIDSEKQSDKSKEIDNNTYKEKPKIYEDNMNLKEEKKDNCSNIEIKKIAKNMPNNNSNITNITNNSSTKSSTLNNITMDVSLINYKKKRKFKVEHSDNSILNAVEINKSLNNIFCRKRKRIKEKIEVKKIKTENISKPVFREFRTYLKKKRIKYKKYFENNKEFWNQFLLGKKTPPFCFIYKEEKYRFKSFKRKFFEFIMSIEDMKTLYENFLNDTDYQLKQKKERKAKNIQAYECCLNNFHKIYNKEIDENCLIFDFEEKD